VKVDDALKRLLDAEARADAEVSRASAERENVIQAALEHARIAREQFAAGIPDLRAPYLGQAEDRAAQAIAELRRKYDERGRMLRAQADAREATAADAALAVLIEAGAV
jgi:V/A-type H+/Na+-transporting ATPase subunit G/H